MVMQFEGREELEAKSNVRELAPKRASKKAKGNAKAAKAEAKSEGTTFEFDGRKFVLPPAETWDVDVWERLGDMEDGNPLAMTRLAKLLVGAEQYAEFKLDADGNRVNRPIEDLGEFITAAMGSLGVDKGE